VEDVSIFRCVETGFRFYHPFVIAGDDKFYRHFGKYDWYYLPWKWEHEECLKYIMENDTVLEVGAANGNFLGGLKRLRNIDGVGLELNSDAVRQARENGIQLINQSIEEHALVKTEGYDIVCSFQVLEHIAEVKNVIASMLACLKPSGKLIISVPNNDSFIKDNPLPSEILNMPPHHMGLWNEESLKNLCKIFPLDLIEMLIEPLQPAQLDTYQYVIVKKALFNSNLLARIYWKLRIYLLLRPLLRLFSSRIVGHSILCVYSRK
jgi:SAM-dependent methyltransferase